MLGGERISASPLQLNAIPGDIHASKCTVTGVREAVVGRQVYTVHTCDMYGNARGIGGDKIHVSITGPVDLQAVVEDVGDGTYIISYDVFVIGSYSIAMTLEDGSHVSGRYLYCYWLILTVQSVRLL